MPVEKVTEKWTSSVNVLTIGTEDAALQVGGETTLPFLHDEGEMPHRPTIAVEVYDFVPEGWSNALREALGDVITDPVQWAKKAQDEWGADLISLRLMGPGAEENPTSPEEASELAKAINDAVNIPLIVWGTGEDEVDNSIYPIVSQFLAGSGCLIGSAKQENYRTLAVTALADGHNIIAESPLDINICKQVNVLLSDMDFPVDRIAIYPTNGALGYGFEYAYSIMERTRLAALAGDKMMAMPMLAIVGSEVQRAKEAKATKEEFPQWGDERERSIAWEISTAIGYLQCGVDILTMAHPEAVKYVKNYIDEFMVSG